MTLSRDAAEPLIAPFLETLGLCVTKAVNHYYSLSDMERALHTPRTKASNINDLMVHYAHEGFADSPDVHFVRRYGHTRLILGGVFEVRLKKLDHNLRSHNVPTQLVMEFLYQLNPMLPGFEPMTNLIVGYRWNKLQTAITGVYVVCPYGTRNEWVIEIGIQGDDDNLTAFSPKPDAPQAPPQRRVTPKTDEADKRNPLSG